MALADSSAEIFTELESTHNGTTNTIVREIDIMIADSLRYHPGSDESSGPDNGSLVV